MSHNWHKKAYIAAGALVATGMMMLTSAGHVGASHAKPSHVRPAGSGAHEVFFSDWQFPNTINPAQIGLVVEQEQAGLTQPSGNYISYNPSAHITPGQVSQLCGPGFTKLCTGANKINVQFKLKSGMKWSDGVAITPNDYIFAWHMLMNANTGPLCTGTCDNVKNVTAKGNVITLHMARKYALAIPNAVVGILPQHWDKLGSSTERNDCLHATGPAFSGCDASATALEAPSLDYFGHADNAVTAGPYQIDNVTVNSEISYSQNPNFTSSMGHISGNPTSMKFVFYASINNMIAGADNHDTDVTTDYTLLQYAQSLQTDSNFTTVVGGGANPEVLIMNAYNHTVNVDNGPSGQNNPTVNAKFRQALYLSVDYAGLLAYAYGVNLPRAQKLISYCAPIFCAKSNKGLFNDGGVEKGRWDPIKHKYVTPGTSAAKADAKKVYNQSGVGNATLFLTTTTGNPVRAAEQQYLQATWQATFSKLTVTLENVAAGHYFDTVWADDGTLAHGHYEAAIFAFGGVPPDPDGWKGNFLSAKCMQADSAHAASDQAYSCFNQKSIDKDLNKAGQSFSGSVRASLYHAFQRSINQNAVWAIIAPRPNIDTVDNKPSAGYQMNSWVSNETWNSQAWKQ